jgi:hypothetical protein
VPASHRPHEDAPASEEVPATQERQEAELAAPTRGLYAPAGHSPHADDPLPSANFPAPQSEQAVEPTRLV